MDCLVVSEPSPTGPGDLIEDGCTPERKLPIVCVQVDEFGQYPELIDTWAPCPGDQNFD